MKFFFNDFEKSVAGYCLLMQTTQHHAQQSTHLVMPQVSKSRVLTFAKIYSKFLKNKIPQKVKSILLGLLVGSVFVRVYDEKLGSGFDL